MNWIFDFMKTYYYVYRPGTKGPTVRHATLTEAEAEAARLATTHPGETFEILQCLGLTSTPVPAPSTFWLDGCEPVSARPVPAAALTNPRYTCTDFKCQWVGPQSEALIGEHPFNAGCQVIACPDCREQTLEIACDEPGCTHRADTGTPTPTGYRFTCAHHPPRIPSILKILPSCPCKRLILS